MDNTYTRSISIVAKACVINESYEDLIFYSFTEHSLLPSPFNIRLEDGVECVLFDNITQLKMKTKQEGAGTLSEAINLSNLNCVPVDIDISQHKIANLSVTLSQELVGKF